MARATHDVRVAAFRYVFDHYDSNQDGLISSYQLLQALNFMEVEITAKELSDLLKKISLIGERRHSAPSWWHLLPACTRHHAWLKNTCDDDEFQLCIDVLVDTAVEPTKTAADLHDKSCLKVQSPSLTVVANGPLLVYLV